MEVRWGRTREDYDELLKYEIWDVFEDVPGPSFPVTDVQFFQRGQEERSLPEAAARPNNVDWGVEGVCR